MFYLDLCFNDFDDTVVSEVVILCVQLKWAAEGGVVGEGEGVVVHGEVVVEEDPGGDAEVSSSSRSSFPRFISRLFLHWLL